MLQTIGQIALLLLHNISTFMMFVFQAIYHCFTTFNLRQFLIQLFRMGYLSLPIIALTAIFSGSAMAIQSYVGFARFHVTHAIPEVVAMSITRELGPVLVGLMFAGRVGAGICAELGSMKVTEQIDALPTLYTYPLRYLIAPRLLAGIMALPLLLIVADVIGIYGGYLAGVLQLDFNHNLYLNNTIKALECKDIIAGLVKATVFGFIVTIVGCYHGYYCHGGAKGVGRATTKSVVLSSVLILLSNYIITLLFFA